MHISVQYKSREFRIEGALLPSGMQERQQRRQRHSGDHEDVGETIQHFQIFRVPKA